MHLRTSIKLLILPVALALAAGPASGQKLTDGEVEFASKTRNTRQLRRQLLYGDTQADPSKNDHVEAIRHAAMEDVYPIYWAGQLRSPEGGKLAKTVEAFQTNLSRM